MPFIAQINIGNSQIFIWEITETESQLHCPLSEQEKQRLALIKSVEDRKRFWAVRQLFQTACIAYQSVFYNDKGKPFLENKFISISHSHQYAMIAVGPQKIGIDIEKIQPKLFKIYPKFTHWIPENDTPKNIEKLAKIWTAKEALYKATTLTGLHFKNDLFVEDFDYQDMTTFAQINSVNYQEKYIVFWEKINTFVWCCVIATE